MRRSCRYGENIASGTELKISDTVNVRPFSLSSHERQRSDSLSAPVDVGRGGDRVRLCQPYLRPLLPDCVSTFLAKSNVYQGLTDIYVLTSAQRQMEEHQVPRMRYCRLPRPRHQRSLQGWYSLAPFLQPGRSLNSLPFASSTTSATTRSLETVSLTSRPPSCVCLAEPAPPPPLSDEGEFKANVEGVTCASC